jgi:hypothetical protein
MKKELLLASALVGSLGLAGVAEAATATMSGSIVAGVSGDDTGAGGATSTGAVQSSELSFAIAETMDTGTKITTSLSIVDEGTAEGDSGGLTLTFTDGSTLDLLEAGSAFGGGIASIPAASGSQGITNVSGNSAPTDLDWADAQDAVGFDWGSAADAFGGMTVGISAATGDDDDTTNTSTPETTYSVGATYAMDAGDSAITIGAGYINVSSSNSVAKNAHADSVALSISAVTGSLTVGAGMSSGDGLSTTGAGAIAEEMDSVSYMEAGASYVSGDMTFTVSMIDSQSKTAALGQDRGTGQDKHESFSASIDYAVASGVTATLGFTDVTNTNDGTASEANGGSSWYVGASVSF